MFEVAHTHTHTRGALPRHHPTDALLATRQTLMIDAITNHQSSILATRRTLAAGSRPGGSAVALPPPRHSHTSSRSNGRPPLAAARAPRGRPLPMQSVAISGNQWYSASPHATVPRPSTCPSHRFPTDSPQDSAWAGPADASQAQKPQHAPRSRPPSRGSDDSLSSTEAARGDLHELLPIRAPTISYELVRSRAISCDRGARPPLGRHRPPQSSSHRMTALPVHRCSEGARRVRGGCSEGARRVFGRQFSRQTGRWYRSTARGRRDV